MYWVLKIYILKKILSKITYKKLELSLRIAEEMYIKSIFLMLRIKNYGLWLMGLKKKNLISKSNKRKMKIIKNLKIS
jgi:hypothetical protein